jgi:hypothetical protein
MLLGSLTAFTAYMWQLTLPAAQAEVNPNGTGGGILHRKEDSQASSAPVSLEQVAPHGPLSSQDGTVRRRQRPGLSSGPRFHHNTIIAADRRNEFVMLEPCVKTAAAPPKGFLSYVPEAQEIRDAALAAIASAKRTASWLPESPQEAEGEWALIAISSNACDDPLGAAAVCPQNETPAEPASQEAWLMERTEGAEAPEFDHAPDTAAPSVERDGAAAAMEEGQPLEHVTPAVCAAPSVAGCVPEGSTALAQPASALLPHDLDRAPGDVLAYARLLVDIDQQQQQARAAACRAEEAWVRIRYSTGATSEEVKAANRARLAARRVFAQAWEEYVAASQALCRSATGLVEHNGPAGAA